MIDCVRVREDGIPHRIGEVRSESRLHVHDTALHPTTAHLREVIDLTYKDNKWARRNDSRARRRNDVSIPLFYGTTVKALANVPNMCVSSRAGQPPHVESGI